MGDHFRKLWGKEAGWAHSVLFTADLKTFADRLSVKVEVNESTTLSNGKVNDEYDDASDKLQTETKVKTRVSVKRELVDDSLDRIASMTESHAHESTTKRRRTRRGRA